MELIKIKDFKVIIENATGKTLHKTNYARYRIKGLVPKNKGRAKYLMIDINWHIEAILDYENRAQSEKIKLGLERKKEMEEYWLLVSKLMNNSLINQ